MTDALQRADPRLHREPEQRPRTRPGALKALGTTAARSAGDLRQQPVDPLQNCGKAPAIAGIQQWFNTPGDAPLTSSSLKGKVVLVDFWAYSCINCQRAIPHVEAWYSTYASDGLQVIGVHTPEYAFEHVRQQRRGGRQARSDITYPVALDNDYTTWDNLQQRLLAGRLPDRRDRRGPPRRASARATTPRPRA